MFCPYCAKEISDQFDFCPYCSAKIPEAVKQVPPAPAQNIPVPQPEQESQPEAQTEPEQSLPTADPVPEAEAPKKKGRLWVPFVIMAGLFFLGLILFAVTHFINKPVTDPSMPWFEVRNGVLYFEEALYTGSPELVVPDSIGGQAITALSSGCFQDCDTLTTVHLPESVSIVGDQAFYGCDSLRGILLPAATMRIGSEAFCGCTALESVSLSGNVQEIGENCFDGCNKLKYLFFNGPKDNWLLLYDEPIGPETNIYAIDGVLFQGHPLP